MSVIRVTGGRVLNGSVQVSGSKNAALAIMAGALLAQGEVTLHNVPAISDIKVMVELLNRLGAVTRYSGTTVVIDATDILQLEAPYDVVRRMRASFSVLGPLLARYGRARVPVPGGCDIGARPVNYHIEGLRKLGAHIHTEHGVYTADAERLRGTNILLDFQSAGATQHLMTAAALAEGKTVIENCATEPEIVDLAQFLRVLGAKVKGEGGSSIEIEGVARLTGGEYTIIPDRMEAGTMAVCAAITGGEVTILGSNPNHLRTVLGKLEETGATVTVTDDVVHVKGPKRPKPVKIKTYPHPGFPTDMQQPFAALLTVADGVSEITENVYESRFRYLNELNRMGAEISISQQKTAVITGIPKLTGAPVNATDLRAGAALIVAGLAADGETEIQGVEFIDRGYDRIVDKLHDLGAAITRED